MSFVFCVFSGKVLTSDAPTPPRLPFKCRFTRKRKNRQGGANGSIRFAPEIEHGANAGLPNALKLLEPFKEKYEAVGWADLMQMASATAVKVAGEIWRRQGGQRESMLHEWIESYYICRERM